MVSLWTWQRPGRSRWWTWAEFDRVCQAAAQGAVQVGPRRNQRKVRCHIMRHVECRAAEAVEVVVAGERVGFLCARCVESVQVAMGTHQDGQ